MAPPLKQYNYSCNHCKHETTINEATIEIAIKWIDIDGLYREGFMPTLKCPNCKKETLEYIEK